MRELPGKIYAQSDRAEIPTGMLEITPPQGTIMFGTEKNTFGVEGMALGLIRTFEEPKGSKAKRIEGTLIRFLPGHIKAHVIRRGLTGDEINIIGKLCGEIDRSGFISGFLPTTIKQTDEVIKNLGKLTTGQDLQFTNAVSELGVVLEKLKENVPEQEKSFRKIAQDLNKLGVTLVESLTGSSRDGMYPIKLIVDKDLQK